MTFHRLVFVVSLLMALTGAPAQAQNPPGSSDAADVVSDPGESTQVRDIGYWRHRISKKALHTYWKIGFSVLIIAQWEE